MSAKLPDVCHRTARTSSKSTPSLAALELPPRYQPYGSFVFADRLADCRPPAPPPPLSLESSRLHPTNYRRSQCNLAPGWGRYVYLGKAQYVHLFRGGGGRSYTVVAQPAGHNGCGMKLYPARCPRTRRPKQPRHTCVIFFFSELCFEKHPFPQEHTTPPLGGAGTR